MKRLMVGALVAGAAGLVAAPGWCDQAAQLARYEASEVHMGTVFRIVLYAPNDELAERAAKAALERVAELDRTLSDYDPHSELRRLETAAANQWVPVSNDLWAVLWAARQVSQATDGAFDVTVGPLTRLWRDARRRGELPSQEDVEARRAAVGYQGLALDRHRQAVLLARPGMQLDPGGIGKGYAADAALAALAAHGVDRALVDAGGDLALGAPPPGRDGWQVAVAGLDAEGDADQHWLLDNCAVATSGDARQFLEIDGQRFSHLIDPRTGMGVTHRASVTVVARSGAVADAWASALSVLGPERGIPLLPDDGSVAASVLFLDVEGRLERVTSDGFDRLVECQAVERQATGSMSP